VNRIPVPNEATRTANAAALKTSLLGAARRVVGQYQRGAVAIAQRAIGDALGEAFDLVERPEGAPLREVFAATNRASGGQGERMLASGVAQLQQALEHAKPGTR
jgi:hypothetical protein